MERKRYHGLKRGKIQFYPTVIIRYVAGLQLTIVVGAAMNCVIFLYRVVSLPDRGQALCFGRHYVDPVTEICRQVRQPRPREFKYAVFYKIRTENSLHQRYGRIMRADAAAWLTGKVYQNYFGVIYVVCRAQQLFNQLRTALSDTHCT